MTEKHDKLFFSLEKLLSRTNLSPTTLPTDIHQWQEFIERINNSFFDFEQERYLLERSMEISSREMIELNERLETAQMIAHIGYWFYNPTDDKILWSKETYRLFDLDPSFPVPPFETVMQMVHEEDRPMLEKLIERSLKDGQDYETEFRVYNKQTNKITWLFVKGHPCMNEQPNTQPGYYLSGIVMDITGRKKSETELAKLNKQLIELSRQAGMSDVATSVLHNIGNILNSINISVSIISELVNNSDIGNLSKLSQLINKNISSDNNYLITDPKGKLIPKFLSKLSDNLIEEYNTIRSELIHLTTNVTHIKDIVVMQKNLSGIYGIKENLLLHEVCDDALQMSGIYAENKQIQIIKNYTYQVRANLDRTKLLQILINLINNAKDSVIHSRNPIPTISISIKKVGKSSIEISIQDNGIGISKENINKIFSMGFSTKRTGHGFGLHNSANYAVELGANLTVKSEGKDKGATFILTLPGDKI